MKVLTLEDYKKAGENFWPKYWYVAKELGQDAKSEDILKVMESLGGVALRFALEEKEGPFGFIRDQIEKNEDGATIIEKPEDAPIGTVAVRDDVTGIWAAYELGN